MLCDRVWILGASDPEMSRIEARLRDGGHRFAYAMADGRRVHPGNAYRADRPDVPAGFQLIAVECGGNWVDGSTLVVDHHRPGDPGFFRGPWHYLQASSLGQVLDLLGVDPDDEDRMIAAADHCLSAAYAGRCPGVNPDALAGYRDLIRAEWLATGGGPAVQRVRDAIEAVAPVVGEAAFEPAAWADALRVVRQSTERALDDAPIAKLGGAPVHVLDDTLPELPEVLARSGRCAVYQIDTPAGRKLGILGAGDGTVPGSGPVEAFIDDALRFGRVLGVAVESGSVYGDPARGFAGAMIAEEEA